MIFSHSFKAMDCDCEVRLACENQHEAEHGFQIVVDEVGRIEAKYSTDRENSPWLDLIREAGSGVPVKVDDESARLLDMAEMGYTLSEGLFDITLTPLVEIWNWNKASMPSSGSITEAMAKSGWSRVDWQKRDHFSLRRLSPYFLNVEGQDGLPFARTGPYRGLNQSSNTSKRPAMVLPDSLVSISFVSKSSCPILLRMSGRFSTC